MKNLFKIPVLWTIPKYRKTEPRNSLYEASIILVQNSARAVQREKLQANSYA